MKFEPVRIRAVISAALIFLQQDVRYHLIQ